MDAMMQINTVPILDVVGACGLETYKKGDGEYGIRDNGKETGGRSLNIQKNIVKDFSKDRGEGTPFNFVKQFRKLTDQETFIWFKEKFGIEDDLDKKLREKQNTVPIASLVWEKLHFMTDAQKQYLISRKIDPELVTNIVRDYKGCIGLLTYEKGVPTGLRARCVEKNAKSRFFSLSGTSGNGVYMYDIDTEKKYIIVVEGLMDFLTLRQHDTNVVGLPSAQQGWDEIKRLHKSGFSIYMCPDVDDPGLKGLDNLKGIPYNVFFVSDFDEECKDIGEFYEKNPYPEIIDAILNTSKKRSQIVSIHELWLEEYRKPLMTGGMLGFPPPKEVEMIFNETSGLIPGKVYTIGAYSNVGKSRFAYFLIQLLLKQNHKVAYVSLEVDRAMAYQEIFASYYGKTRKEIREGFLPTLCDFDNLTIVDDIRNLKDIIEFIETSGNQFIFIDFIQNIYIPGGGSSYEKEAQKMPLIQAACIKSKATVFALSQVSNNMGKDLDAGRDSVVSLKGAGEHFASSDVIITLSALDGELDIGLHKNKYGPRGKHRTAKANFETSRFTITSM